VNLRPRLSSTADLARVVPPMKTTAVIAADRIGVLGISTPFGIPCTGRGSSALPIPPPSVDTAIRASIRSIRKPQSEARAPSSRGSAVRVMRCDDRGTCANESAGDITLAGVIGSCTWIDVELLFLEDAAHARDRAGREHVFGSEPFAGTTTRSGRRG